MKLLSWLLVISVAAGVHSAGSHCRCLPSDECWPSVETWKQFNSSINGHLVNPLPPASPCHDPNFDAVKCKAAHANWGVSYWRISQPGALVQTTWEVLANETWGCQLNATSSTLCTQGNIPTYAANVSSVKEIQKAVRFAAKHNLRFVIKNTGHDYLGRSTAAGALSVWVHNLNTVTLHDHFVPARSHKKPTIAITIQTGVPIQDMYAAVAKKNWVVVGGASTNVAGGGGYVGAGGHSPISPNYGLAADNALQFTVVLANGQVVVANEAQHSDLFWALRGGGASTWGVVIDVTFRAHPGPSVVSYASFTAYLPNAPAFRSLVEAFVSLQPNISEDGFAGFSYIANNTLLFGYSALDKNKTQVAASLQHFVDYAKSTGAYSDLNITEYSSWNDYWINYSCPTGNCQSLGGGSAYLASRLIPAENFERPAELTSALLNISNTEVGYTISHLVAGGNVSKRDPNSVAVNPAWRNALWHTILTSTYPDNASPETRKSIHNRLTDINGVLRDITPGSGCYMNEADANEPNWQQAFFGSHYERLRYIKSQVDPKHLFICRNCVASDEWDESLNCRIR